MKKLLFLLASLSLGLIQAQNNALDFENLAHPINSEYVEVPYNSSLAITGDLTIEAWVKLESLSGIRSWGIASRYVSYDPPGTADYTDQRCYGLIYEPGLNQFTLRMTFDGDFRNGVIVVSTVSSIPADEWIHIAGVYEQGPGPSSTVRIYMNGQLENTVTNNEVPTIHAGSTAQVPLLVGADFDPFSPDNLYLDGTIDELRVWSTALSQATIQDWMCQEITTDHPNYNASTSDDLELYFDFATGSGTAVTDLSANGNDGNFETTNAGGTNTWVSSTAPVPFTTTVDNADILAASTYPSDNPDISTFINPSIGIENTGMDISSDKVIQSLEVASGADLTIPSNLSLTVNSDIVNDGTIKIEDEASLVQVENAANTGSGTYNVDREVSSVNFARYNFWASPVIGETYGDAFPNSNSGDWYTWDPFSGQWDAQFATDVIFPGRGFTATPDSSGLSNTPITETITFSGDDIINGSFTAFLFIPADSFALIGNPYPSAVNANDFINANSADLTGTLYFYDDQDTTQGVKGTGSYATYTTSGGTAARVGGMVPDGFIQTAQGFMVQAQPAVPFFALAGWDNTMRVSGNNTQFFKNSNRERFWLNLSNDSTSNQILIAFEDGATEEVDWAKDGKIYKANRFSAF